MELCSTSSHLLCSDLVRGDRGINSGLISSGKDRGINIRMWLRHHKDGLHLAKQVELNDQVFSRTREGYKKWLYLNLALA